MKHIQESIRDRKGFNGTSIILIPRACKDADGNVYDAVRIGNQVWMAENLRTEHFNNGDPIPLDTSREGGKQGVPGHYYSEGKHIKQDGYFYNWHAVTDPRGIAPKGWHVPSQEEFKKLRNYIRSNPAFLADGANPEYNGKCLASKDGWERSSGIYDIGNDPQTNNSTGFNAFPAGYWLGSPDHRGYGTGFWSSTASSTSDAYGWYLFYSSTYFDYTTGSKAYGFSVRCVRDNM